MANTIVVAEATNPVIWTKPEDLTYSPDRPLPPLGLTPGKGFQAGMADGRVVRVPPTVSEKSLRAAITATGLDIIGNDWAGQPPPGGIPRPPGAGDPKAGGDAKSGGTIESKDYPKGKGR